MFLCFRGPDATGRMVELWEQNAGSQRPRWLSCLFSSRGCQRDLVPGEWDEAQVPPGGLPTNCTALPAGGLQGRVASPPAGAALPVREREESVGGREPECLN